MAGPFLSTELIRANADCPATTLPETGELTWQEHYYLPHSSGRCTLAVFRPAVSFQDAPVAIFAHGGQLGASHGWGSMTDEFFLGKMGNLAEAMSAAGWAIVTIDYPMSSLNRHQRLPGGSAGNTKILGSWDEIHPLALWPEQPAYVAAALQYIKSNHSGVPGLEQTLYGTDLWGLGNSIDRTRMVLVGEEWGAQMALYAALQPSHRYAFEPPLAETTMDPYVARATHRVRAVIALNPGPIEYSQFYVGQDPLSSAYYYFGTQIVGVGNKWAQPPGTPFYLKGDRFHPFMRCESFRRWSGIAMEFKIQSPWFELAQADVENANIPMFVEFEGEGYDTGVTGWDEKLSAADWSPGTVRSNSAGGKAWIHPQDGRIQGEPWRIALANFGSDAAAPIRKSVVRYTATGTYPVYGGSEYGAVVLAWLSTL